LWRLVPCEQNEWHRVGNVGEQRLHPGRPDHHGYRIAVALDHVVAQDRDDADHASCYLVQAELLEDPAQPIVEVTDSLALSTSDGGGQVVVHVQHRVHGRLVRFGCQRLLKNAQLLL
jgi:hypothetical protein